MEKDAPLDLAEILNGFSYQIAELAGMIEAQKFALEDLYALGFTDAATFATHAAVLKQLPEYGNIGSVDPRLLEARREAREKHLTRLLDAAQDRIIDRHG